MRFEKAQKDLRQAGQSMVEFALILVLVALVVIGTMMVMGNTVQNDFWNIIGTFDTTQTPQQISCHQAHYNCSGH
jgi:Flp pilus assembly pilin Flp